eukprot:TRINITY_DN10028_c0_g1_i2.p1 TRINITY_DN10028_c0_g1~~TRINITY_DN10028_c0_g1_i2.p1  ORF type:complete len:184 (-),score=46.96 TRINITY_DN10028_c0_g1_i2:277-828(-)
MFPSVRKVPSNPLPASKKGIKKAPAKQPSSSTSTSSSWLSSSSSSASIGPSSSKSSILQSSKGRIKSSPSPSSSSSLPSKSTSLIIRPFPNKHRASPAPVTIIVKSPVPVPSSSHHPILQNVHYLPLIMQHIDQGWHAILRLTCKAFHRAWKGKAPLLKIYFTYYTSFPQQASRVSCSCYHHR